ncbi:MAG: helix-turn-helix transcriptional regulator [Lachnospiraceae bacterium]|nr:helix-turn-helix transcriptional regulator [Lachnospiraceae bacterium]
MTQTTLGAYLKLLRKQHAFSQEFVASHLNIIRQTYSHYETGRNTPPADMLFQLAELYGVSVESLLELSVRDKGQCTSLSYYQSNMSSAAPKKTDNSISYYTLTNEELDLLTHFRTLDTDNREEIVDIVKLKCKRITRRKKESKESGGDSCIIP